MLRGELTFFLFFICIFPIILIFLPSVFFKYWYKCCEGWIGMRPASPFTTQAVFLLTSGVAQHFAYDLWRWSLILSWVCALNWKWLYLIQGTACCSVSTFFTNDVIWLHYVSSRVSSHKTIFLGIYCWLHMSDLSVWASVKCTQMQ